MSDSDNLRLTEISDGLNNWMSDIDPEKIEAVLEYCKDHELLNSKGEEVKTCFWKDYVAGGGDSSTSVSNPESDSGEGAASTPSEKRRGVEPLMPEPDAWLLESESGEFWSQTFPQDPAPDDANNLQRQERCFAVETIQKALRPLYKCNDCSSKFRYFNNTPSKNLYCPNCGGRTVFTTKDEVFSDAGQ